MEVFLFSRVISSLSFMTHDVWTNVQQHLNTFIEILLQKTEKQQREVEGMGRNVLCQGTLTCATRKTSTLSRTTLTYGNSLRNKDVTLLSHIKFSSWKGHFNNAKHCEREVFA